MSSRTLISIIMPVYNASDFLKDSIESMLSQTYTNFEFLIIDDGSDKLTKEILNGYKKKDSRIHIIRNNKNQGITKSLNKGIGKSSGKYVIRMDSDDWAKPNRLSRQVELMNSNSEIVVSGSYINVCDEGMKFHSLRKYPLSDENIRKKIFRYSPFAHPATIWRKSILDKVGGYNENIEAAQDYDLYFRVGRHGKFMNIPEPLLHLRMHKNSISVSKSDSQINNTFKIRETAVNEYGYSISKSDEYYSKAQKLTYKMIPTKHRFHLFNFFRKFDTF